MRAFASANARRQSLVGAESCLPRSGTRFAACARRDVDFAALFASSFTVAGAMRGAASATASLHSAAAAKPSTW